METIIIARDDDVHCIIHEYSMIIPWKKEKARSFKSLFQNIHIQKILHVIKLS